MSQYGSWKTGAGESRVQELLARRRQIKPTAERHGRIRAFKAFADQAGLAGCFFRDEFWWDLETGIRHEGPLDGWLRFDSRWEAQRWCALRQNVEVLHLRRQVSFPLNATRPDGAIETIARYVADFVYTLPAVGEVIEDAKGLKTEMYRLKKRWFEAQYGKTILETHKGGKRR